MNPSARIQPSLFGAHPRSAEAIDGYDLTLPTFDEEISEPVIPAKAGIQGSAGNWPNCPGSPFSRG